MLDTNALVSALLFAGIAARLLPLWQSRRIVLLISRPILAEYYRVLAYPKFSLKPSEIRTLIEEEVLPFAEIVAAVRSLKAACRDPGDQKFLDCAVAAKAEYIISGDLDLRALTSFRSIPILTPAELLAKIAAR